MPKNKEKILLFEDVVVIILSIIVAVVLAKTGILTKVLTSTQELKAFGSFFTGMFFTSIFTTAPAIVTLGAIAQTHSIILTALFGAMGAMVGDLIIFRFIRDRFAEHLLELIEHKKVGREIKTLSKFRFFRWMTFLIGGLIIASPLPDELGISLLGFSKMKMSWFIGISFTFNFIGILLIGIVANNL